VRSWQVAYRGLLPDAYLDQMRPEDRASRYSFGEAAPGEPYTIVLVRGGRVCGFATTGPCGDTDVPPSGELLALYVEPELWGRGAGRRLIQAARRRLAAHGFVTACLWVLRDNERAEHFYRMDGWRPDGSRRSREVWGIQVDEERWRRHLP
jgi:GNAT superfamily N-acetyltransferase